MVETRSQSALVPTEKPAQATESTPPADAPGWQKVTTKIQADVQRENSINEKFQDMQAAMMANLHKLLEIGLGKRIDAGEMLTQHTGVLGSPQNSPKPLAPEHVPIVVEAANSSKQQPILLEETDDIRVTQSDQVPHTHNFSYKLLCPKFDGSDFRGWYSKLEQYFEAEMVPDSAKVRVVMLHMEGKALQWDQFVSKSLGGVNQTSWTEYLTLLRERFAP
ncbi:hypothetical protein GQ457_13G010980 [Hibiscus cannabinus]